LLNQSITVVFVRNAQTADSEIHVLQLDITDGQGHFARFNLFYMYMHICVYSDAAGCRQ